MANSLKDIIDTLIAEAIGEGPEGMRLVGETIINRANQSGKTYGQVVRAPKQYTGHSNPGSAAKRAQQNPALRAIAEAAWQEALQPGDPTMGADHYFNPNVVTPKWAAEMTPTITKGGHAFYRSGPAPRPQAPTPMPPINRPSPVTPATQSLPLASARAAAAARPSSSLLPAIPGPLSVTPSIDGGRYIGPDFDARYPRTDDPRYAGIGAQIAPMPPRPAPAPVPAPVEDRVNARLRNATAQPPLPRPRSANAPTSTEIMWANTPFATASAAPIPAPRPASRQMAMPSPAPATDATIARTFAAAQAAQRPVTPQQQAAISISDLARGRTPPPVPQSAIPGPNPVPKVADRLPPSQPGLPAIYGPATQVATALDVIPPSPMPASARPGVSPPMGGGLEPIELIGPVRNVIGMPNPVPPNISTAPGAPLPAPRIVRPGIFGKPQIAGVDIPLPGILGTIQRVTQTINNASGPFGSQLDNAIYQGMRGGNMSAPGAATAQSAGYLWARSPATGSWVNVGRVDPRVGAAQTYDRLAAPARGSSGGGGGFSSGFGSAKARSEAV